MPKGSPELTNARRDEIISACADLYETMNFRDITLKDIGERTSFTRTLIYYYFHTKEEIFLALMQREYDAWVADLDAIREGHDSLTVEGFADELAGSLERRSRLLKLMSMNHYDMEANSRMDNLVQFKAAYWRSIQAVERCLEKFVPSMSGDDRRSFTYSFFPFLFGIYPYTVVTEKQREALALAHADYVYMSISEIARPTIVRLLSGFRRRRRCARGPSGPAPHIDVISSGGRFRVRCQTPQSESTWSGTSTRSART